MTTSAKTTIEAPSRIEPARLEEAPERIADLIATLSSASAALGGRLHPTTAANLADLVRAMNCYYSNLIEGHNTRPRDIERALKGDLDDDEERRHLQIEAAAHIRVQTEVDRMAAAGALPSPTSVDFIQWLHREFYRDAGKAMLTIEGDRESNREGDREGDRAEFIMEPGEWRSKPEHDVAVGRHVPPSSPRVGAFMAYFEKRYDAEVMGFGARIMAMASAHHRFNYIHPFPDGNGRVSRLMSHAMALNAGVGAHGLWSISRGLARGLESRSEYRRYMDLADTPRQDDLDGRGNLSLRALIEFTEWFLRVAIDQVTFMANLFDLETLGVRLTRYVERSETLRPEAAALLREALTRGRFERGEAPRITGLPERTARRVLNDIVDEGLLASESPKTAVSLRFPAHALDRLFPRLYPEA